MRLALYQPDIPQNTGTLLRLGACLDVPVDIIEPCGFTFGERALRRAGMDYLDRAAMRRHACWADFEATLRGSVDGPLRRLVLLTTSAAIPYTGFRFDPTDTLLLGRESAGVPPEVHARADAAIVVPMAPGTRSLNIAVAGAMVVGEALRQCGMFPMAAGEQENEPS